MASSGGLSPGEGRRAARPAQVEEDERGEEHEEPLAQRSGNFFVVELAYAEEVSLGEVEANFLQSLAHGCRSNYPLVNRTKWESMKEHGLVYKLPS